MELSPEWLRASFSLDPILLKLIFIVLKSTSKQAVILLIGIEMLKTSNFVVCYQAIPNPNIQISNLLTMKPRENNFSNIGN